MTTLLRNKPGIGSTANQNSRRSFLAVGTAASIGAGAIGMAGFAQQAAAQETKGESILDKWVRTKKAVVGVDLTSKPMRFRDENGKAAGIGIDYLNALLKDVGAEPEYVEMPFGQTFAALAAGKFEMIGTFVTMLPSRGHRGTFAGFPAHYQQNIAYLRDGLRIDKLEQLNSPDRKIACQQGTSEVGMLAVTFPKAEIQTFPQMPDCFNALGAGRVDAVVTDIQNVPSILKTFPKVTVAPGTINTVPNTFFMPHNDFKLWAFITNWLRYKASDRVIQGIQDKWYGLELREKYKLATVTIGPGGEPLTINPA
jgi:polar amino acid transport system substrate-binding protein